MASPLLELHNTQNISVRAMVQNQAVTSTKDRAELLQAHAELWCHIFGYLKSMALRSAIELGIPNAIHHNGGSASLLELLTTLPLTTNKQSCLPRLMRFLASSGVFAEDILIEGTTTKVYRLTPVSRLLVDDIDMNDNTCQLNFALLAMSQFQVMASLCLGKWLKNNDEKTPFAMAHGMDLWGATSHDAEYNMLFNEAMASDSRFVADIVVRECAELFLGVRSLVDVGGGNGAIAMAIAKAFPHIKCSVLDLPHVIYGTPTDGKVEFVVGDMMYLVPSADIALLKFVLHDWNDEDCVRILTRCKEAIHNEEGSGKVIIIDTVIGSPSQQILEAQLSMDLCMMALTTGKEREEEEWRKIFVEAGFSRYKIMPILGVKSLIELYP
uniref:O-methyltransferase domain-containing protein n=1 Tax=Oryza punctata TaxID=4537 RepID=A0A0E0LVJ3_ORYPU